MHVAHPHPLSTPPPCRKLSRHKSYHVTSILASAGVYDPADTAKKAAHRATRTPVPRLEEAQAQLESATQRLALAQAKLAALTQGATPSGSGSSEGQGAGEAGAGKAAAGGAQVQQAGGVGQVRGMCSGSEVWQHSQRWGATAVPLAAAAVLGPRQGGLLGQRGLNVWWLR